MVESLLLVSILGMTAAAVGQGMVQMSNSAVSNNDSLWLSDQLLSNMENLRATYTTLTVPYSNSQTITTPDGHSYTLTSSIQNANPGTGMQTNFLELEVAIGLPGGSDTMCTYVSE